MSNINTAISIYVGYGITPFPKENSARLAGSFDIEAARQLESQINALLSELEKLQPDWTAHTLASASKWAVTELKRSHPELDDKATDALEWIYSWWWK